MVDKQHVTEAEPISAYLYIKPSTGLIPQNLGTSRAPPHPSSCLLAPPPSPGLTLLHPPPPPAMATEAYAPPMKAGKEGFQGTPELQHRIRITLSSKSVKNLEKG
jgi:hypothetical protein